MKVKIQRSDEYVISRRIATGDNAPASLSVDVSPSALTESARRLIIQAFREYPEILDGLNYDRAYLPSSGGTFGRIYFRADIEEADAATVSALIESAFAELEAKRKAADLEAADREREKADALAERVAAAEGIISDYLAAPDALPDDYTGTALVVTGLRLGGVYPAGVLIDGWHPRWRELRAETERRIFEAETKRLAKKGEASIRRSAQIADWVAAHGDYNQKGRHAIGLLPEDEVLRKIRSEQFAALNDFRRYKKLNASEIPCICEGDEGATDPSFSVAKATEADAVEYEALSAITTAIRAVHPEAVVDLRVHTAKCSGCGEDTQRRGVLVTITVGELTMSREYAV